jgi:hypothetical protein
VRELVGEDGGVLAEFWLSVLQDRTATTKERLDASRLLADRGFGKSPGTISLNDRPDMDGSPDAPRGPQELVIHINAKGETIEVVDTPWPGSETLAGSNGG